MASTPRLQDPVATNCKAPEMHREAEEALRRKKRQEDADAKKVADAKENEAAKGAEDA